MKSESDFAFAWICCVPTSTKVASARAEILSISCISGLEFPSCGFSFWQQSSDWLLSLSITDTIAAAEMFLLKKLLSFSSLGWLVREEETCLLSRNWKILLIRRMWGHVDLCRSSRTLSNFSLSSALIWSERTNCSTTCWAIPGRVLCFRSRSTAPETTTPPSSSQMCRTIHWSCLIQRSRNNNVKVFTGSPHHGRWLFGVGAESERTGSWLEASPSTLCPPPPSPPQTWTIEPSPSTADRGSGQSPALSAPQTPKTETFVMTEDASAAPSLHQAVPPLPLWRSHVDWKKERTENRSEHVCR